MKPSQHRIAAALPVIAASATAISISSAAPQYWKTSSAAAWDSATWATAPGGTYDQPWASGSDVTFEDNLGIALTIAGPSAATNFNSITANESVTVTPSNTLGTGGTIATVNVAAGKTLNFAGQALSTAAGTGFIKSGPGTWALANGNAYAGGFTLNAGTVAVGGVNAMGSGGALVINGGTISSNAAGTARDLSGKFTSITLGGDVTLGDLTNNGLLTFNTATNLGGGTRILTVNSAVTHTGAITGGVGVGLTKAGPGVLTLGGTNTYPGATTISAGVLTINGTGALPGGIGTNGGYSVASGAALAVSNAITDANITTMLGTTNFAAGSAIGFDTTTAARAYAANLGNTAQGALGLVKLGTNTLTLSGANTYSGGTTVNQPNDATGITVASATALGSGPVLINGGQQFSGSVAVNANLSLGNAVTLRRGAGSSNRALLALGSGATWSGGITVDNSSANGIAAIMASGTNAATASVVSGNIGFSTLGTGTSANASLALRTNTGKVTGSIGLSTGYLQLLDASKWEFSNASNTWGTLDINNNGAIVTVGATNTLSPSGVVFSNTSTGGTLQLNNQAGTSAFSQTIAGLSGTVKVGLSTGTATLTLNTAADQSSSGVISGGISLVKSGPAKQTLSGVHTYTGSTTISGGTLALGNTGALPTADLSISSASLDLRKGTSVRTQLVNHLALTNATLDLGLNAAPDQIDALDASTSGTTTIKLHGSTPVGVYNLITTQAPLSGTFVLDTSDVTPSGFPTTYSGSLQGNNYVLTVSGAATPFVAYWRGDVSSVWSDSSLAPNSNWANGASGTSDAGQLVGPVTDVYFSASNAANTNTTLGANININTLTFATGSATVGGAQTLTILSEFGTGLDVLSGASATLQTGNLVSTAAAAVEEGGTLTVNSGGLGAGPLLVDGLLNLNMSTTHESLSGFSTGTIGRSIAGAGTLTISGTTTSTYDGTIQDGAGTLALSKGGSSTLTLTGNSTYTGGTTITGGILKANSSTAVGNGTVAINGGIRLSLGDNVTLTNAVTIGANSSPQGAGILEASSSVTGTATLTGPINITASPVGGGHFINVSSGGSFDVKSVITSTVPVIHRSGSITYWGGGTGYTAMTVTGTARLGANNGLATTATVTLGASGAATLDLAGNNQSLAGIVKSASAATIGNSSTTTDSLLSTTGTSTYDGVIANAVGAGTRVTGLAVEGGSLTLGGINTYTGNTTIASGAGLTLSDNAQLRFAIGATANGISGAGSGFFNGDFNIDTTVTDASPLTSGSWTLENVASIYGTSFQVLSGTTPWTATGDVWSKTVGSKNYSFDEATGVLTLSSGGGGFDAWAASKGLTGADAAFGADPDHDGVDNGLEFVLGGEPNPANAGSNSKALLPTVSQSGGNLIFSFKRKDLSESGVALSFQWSTDLSFTSPAHDVPVGATDSSTDTIVVDVSEDSPDADTDTIVITVPAAKAAGRKLFGRLNAVQSP
ncbi:autotransporter-associated beta strand repeat-containing protein [Haloferula sp. BvORR071]|uniref:beta strand repeat-containing protein n=1 Tax=Haloferula sp. BvORR071 TaxID=1396141 RepID=UPI000557EB2A|nr:autotransporter-associated beta strand repeat-containing protein [Haloferula sp. BvORR071]